MLWFEHGWNGGGSWIPCGDVVCHALSHPGSRKQNRSLHTRAQDVQITRTANNMVNRYNISLNYKLESLQNDPWSKRNITERRRNLSVGASSTGTTGGEAGLVFIFWLLLVLLVGLQHLVRPKATIEASLSRLMVATQQVGENMT
jgi:tetrahydromethanopterin S-methyltransferase subunit F